MGYSESSVQETINRLTNLSNGTAGQELEALCAKGLQVVQAHKGFILCRFIIHDRLSDEDGNWHAGAIAVLVDNLVGATTYSATGDFSVTVDYCISYYSKAKIHEEVEIEAKVVGMKGKLSSIVLEVRKKETGELIALGKEWTTSAKVRARL
ncbi:putative Acyl-CoA thioesterase [Quillaja saponaria]|uniref:Acyl-coenzyme A thioesterase 13 n=1 Tax=Quillaja saponaria TaxID=32244 RepID=A0AAD7PQ42_QUISA|nr:putative Acyl-CoA thioesterase [Quillaja saponaria]